MTPMKTLKPDDTLKTFWRNKYRFADVFNYMFFGGNEIIKPEQLADHDTNESNVVWDKRTKSVSLSRTRDLIKEYKNGMHLILIGIEDQMKATLSSSDEFLSGMISGDRIWGTITLVLYYGEEPWDGPQNLSDMLDVPEEFREFVNDYHVYILDVKHTDTEQFHNRDNRILFAMLHDFTSGQVTPKEFVKKYSDMQIYQEILAAFAAITGKENLAGSLVNEKGGETQMYKTWERWEKEIAETGRSEGIQVGRSEGRQEGIQAFILDYLEEGFSEERILVKLQKRFSLTAEQAQEYFDKYAPVNA